MALKSPNKDPPLFPRPAHPTSSPNVLLNPTDTEIRNGIWGPWYWFAKGTLQMFTVPPEASKLAKVLCNLPNIICITVLIVRSAFLLYVMMRSRSLSIFWSYATIVFFMSIHSMVSAITLFVYKTNPFVPKVITYLRKATFNRITRVQKITYAKNIITIVIWIIPAVVYVVESFIRYSHGEADKFNAYYAGTSRKRNSLYGNTHWLYFADALIVLLGSYFSASVLILYLRTNEVLCREYANFNRELMAHINDGTITRLTTIKSFQSQLIEYLCMACYINNTTTAFVNQTFMAGIMTQIAAQFAMYSFNDHMSGAQTTLYVVWVVQSIFLLFYAIRKPAILHNMMTETKHLIWLDQGIWSKCADPEVHTTARNIVDRISAVDYASKALTSTSASNYLFNAVLIIIPFFVDILDGSKYIDPSVHPY